MKKHRRFVLLLFLLAGLALLVAACGQAAETEPPVAETPEMAATEPPEGAQLEVPFLDRWLGSGHADAEAEAFTHWDEDDPQEVPTSCAKCHSTPGYRDFLGVDGSEFGVVDSAAPTGTTVECVACHNDVTLKMTSVVMPSGLELTGLGDEARCMQCHQGRESTISVNEALTEAGVTDEDEVITAEGFGFVNIHYYAAAATKYGTLAKGGYEYEDKSYDARFDHVEGYQTCIQCHDMHTLEVKVAECQGCHEVESVEDLANVRMPGSAVDYDGDGDLSEGIAFEIQGLQEALYAAMQSYASSTAGTAIVYDAHSYPYFFIDTNEDGEVSEDEASFPNSYNTWTPRLLKAAYNYQVSQKDPGAFAHGGKYIIELLYDSIEDLGGDVTSLRRIDHGHFAGSEEAFRHWDEDGEVSASCSKCHSAAGLPLFLTEGGVTISQDLANGFQCSTCHNDLSEFTRYEVASVTFPSGATIDSGSQNTNLCMNCHQGRESTVSVNERLAATGVTGEDEVITAENFRFINIHYYPAGATRYGSQAQGIYEYPNREYNGYFEHVENASQCTDCHDAHQLTVKVEDVCSICHTVESVEDLKTIREERTGDFDGDGDTEEGLGGEFEGVKEKLYAAIQAYAADTAGTPILYNAHRYPYFFADPNENGEVDEGESGYSTWTPRLLKAAYNYQYASKDPGAFAHNGHYVIQAMYDSIADLGGSTAGMVRP